MGLRTLRVVVLSSILGCSQGVDEVDNAAWRGDPKVTGVVTLDGEPLVGAKVSFDPAVGTSLIAVTDESGRFSLDLTESGESAIGKYAVRILHSPAESVGETDSGKPDRVPARYNRDTELVVDIRDGENSFNFSLLSRPHADE